MFTRYMLVLLIGLFAIPQAFADYYKYRDKEGVLRFTDNLGEVPADQRPKMERYREVKPVKQPEEKVRRGGRKKSETQSTNRQKKGAATETQWLIQEQRNLNKIHRQLMNEKMTLANDSNHIKTTQDAKIYRKRLNALNERIAKFEKRRYKYLHQASRLKDQIEKEVQRQNRPKKVVGPPRKCEECDQKSAAQ